MIAIITGDIINSRADKQNLWRDKLKSTLSLYGNTPNVWEIFRGDSFQLEISPDQAVKSAILLKASIKQIKELDVRIGIGIGEKDFVADRLTESTGSAFVYSGECFDDLKKYSLKIKSSEKEFDEEMNLYFALALLTIKDWLPATSEIVEKSILFSDINQVEIARKIGKSQSTISEGLKRAGYEEIMKMEKRYRKLVSKYFLHKKKDN